MVEGQPRERLEPPRLRFRRDDGLSADGLEVDAKWNSVGLCQEEY